MKKKLYDLVKQLLEEYPKLRDSDKHLIWNVWGSMGLLNNDGTISREEFLSSPSLEAITRLRRKVQEHYPGLRPSQKIQEARFEKQLTKGNFIYQEELL